MKYFLLVGDFFGTSYSSSIQILDIYKIVKIKLTSQIFNIIYNNSYNINSIYWNTFCIRQKKKKNPAPTLVCMFFNLRFGDKNLIQLYNVILESLNVYIDFMPWVLSDSGLKNIYLYNKLEINLN